MAVSTTKAAIIEFYLRGLSEREICSRLRCSLGQVRVVLSRAIADGEVERQPEGGGKFSFSVAGTGLLLLTTAAQKRGIAPRILAARLLHVIAEDPELIRAVLDDGVH